MKITIWVMLAVGLIEVGANLFFLIHAARGKSLDLAKKFHGDFPAFADDRAWMAKINVSASAGVFALIAFFALSLRLDAGIFWAYFFAVEMLLMCVTEAVLYGKKHLPALLSIIPGLVIAALVFFRV